LTSLCATSVRLDLTSIHGIMIGIITTRAPQIFGISLVRKVHKHYIQDYFRCRESFVQKFLEGDEMKWSLRQSTCPGKNIPDGVTYILTDTFLRFVHTISEDSVVIEVIVNTDQTLVIYAAGAVRVEGLLTVCGALED
jgi:hypothetical protein